MANFISYPSQQNISGKTIAVVCGGTIQIGVWGCREGTNGPLLGLLAGYEVGAKFLKDDGVIGVVEVQGKVVGETTIQIVNSTMAVWDTIHVFVHSPVADPKPHFGFFPPDVIDAAILSHDAWGVPVSVVLAQWAVESNWGTQMPSGSNNPFGIKAGKGQPSVKASTQEEVNGQMITIVADFRKFGSITQAFDEHGRLLATNPHFAKAMSNRDDPDAFADALTGVYATASNYGMVLKLRMRTYNLYQYDEMADPTPAPQDQISPSSPLYHPPGTLPRLQ